MFDIHDKVVLITGAATGIGASVVKILLEEGIKHAAILDIDDKHGINIEKELNIKHGRNKVKFIKCDITQKDELLDAFRTVKDQQGYIDLVINNAGIFDDKRFVKQIEVNFTALVSSSLQAWELMRKDEGGRGGTVINITSIAAFFSVPCLPVYSATKSAVVKFSTLLGDELNYSRTGVRLLTVGYGVTDTQMILKENLNSFDPWLENPIDGALRELNLQTPDQAAQGLVEVYKRGKSASVWLVTSGKPAVDVTEKYLKGSELFNNVILN